MYSLVYSLNESSSKLPSIVQKRYFDDEGKQGMPMLAATMAKFTITSRAKKANTMVPGMLRVCVT